MFEAAESLIRSFAVHFSGRLFSVRTAENNKRAAAAAAGGPPFVRYDVPPETQVAIDAHLACVNRNRRCVLAYLMTRLAALRAVWWSSGAQVHEEMRAVCSPAELTAHSTYDALVTKYMLSIDLTLTDSQTPPKTLLVEVRPLRDVGQIDTELGTVNLERNTVQLLRRTDAEMLIRKGDLEQVKKV